jgi:hypothetical protein
MRVDGEQAQRVPGTVACTAARTAACTVGGCVTHARDVTGHSDR